MPSGRRCDGGFCDDEGGSTTEKREIEGSPARNALVSLFDREREKMID